MPNLQPAGYREPVTAGRINDRFLMTLEDVQLKVIDMEAEKAGLSRNAFVRKALYHYTSCENGPCNA